MKYLKLETIHEVIELAERRMKVSMQDQNRSFDNQTDSRELKFDKSYFELPAFIGSLSQEEQAELTALMQIGRDKEEFDQEHFDWCMETERQTANLDDYLVSKVLLSVYLRDGLTKYERYHNTLA